MAMLLTNVIDGVRYIILIWILFLIRHLYLNDMWLGVAPKYGCHKDVFRRDWTMCLKYVNHSRLNSQHNWRGPS